MVNTTFSRFKSNAKNISKAHIFHQKMTKKNTNPTEGVEENKLTKSEQGEVVTEETKGEEKAEDLLEKLFDV